MVLMEYVAKKASQPAGRLVYRCVLLEVRSHTAMHNVGIGSAAAMLRPTVNTDWLRLGELLHKQRSSHIVIVTLCYIFHDHHHGHTACHQYELLLASSRFPSSYIILYTIHTQT